MGIKFLRNCTEVSYRLDIIMDIGRSKKAHEKQLKNIIVNESTSKKFQSRTTAKKEHVKTNMSVILNDGMNSVPNAMLKSLVRI